MRAKVVSIAVVLVLLAVPACARAGDSWAGKTILMKKSGVQFGNTVDGQVVWLGKLNEMEYLVRADKDGWLKVRYRGQEGWFAKADAVLLEDAVHYFTGVIAQHPKD